MRIGHRIGNTTLYTYGKSKKECIEYVNKWREAMLNQGVVLFVDLEENDNESRRR
jgi:hypothetical protein